MVNGPVSCVIRALQIGNGKGCTVVLTRALIVDAGVLSRCSVIRETDIGIVERELPLDERLILSSEPFYLAPLGRRATGRFLKVHRYDRLEAIHS